MSTNINIQGRIEQLLFIADSFLKLSEDLGDFYFANRDQIAKNLKVLNSHEIKALMIQQKLYFSEVLLVLRTIFEKSKKPREVSYEQLLKEISESTPYHSEYKKIQKDYDKSGLNDLRDQLIAHKDLKSAGDPSTHYNNPIDPENIKYAREIVDSLLKLNNQYSSDPTANNWIGIHEHLKPLIETITKNLEKLIEGEK